MYDDEKLIAAIKACYELMFNKEVSVRISRNTLHEDYLIIYSNKGTIYYDLNIQESMKFRIFKILKKIEEIETYGTN